MVTSRDVARVAGVSQATVSMVISGKRFVSPALRSRVLAAIDELGYHPNEVARSLKTRRSGVVGVVVPSLGAHSWNQILEGVEDVLTEAGYDMILSHASEDYDRERQLLDLLYRRRVDGVLVPPVGPESREALNQLIRRGVQVVMNSRHLDGVEADAVVADTRGGARAAISHLLSLGRRRVAILVLPEWSYPGGARLAGYRDALADHGIPFDPDLAIHGRSSDENGFLCTSRLLDGPRPPDAIVATHANTLGVLRCLKARGLRVPEDVALICFDELPWLELFDPPVTSIWQPQRELGAAAAAMLVERLRGEGLGEPRLVTMETKVIIRRSCGAAAVGRTAET